MQNMTGTVLSFPNDVLQDTFYVHLCNSSLPLAGVLEEYMRTDSEATYFTVTFWSLIIMPTKTYAVLIQYLTYGKNNSEISIALQSRYHNIITRHFHYIKVFQTLFIHVTDCI